MLAAVTTTAALVILFVVAPFAVAGVVLAFVSWRSGSRPAPVRTSEVLATGDPARGELMAVRTLGGPLDARPMLRLRVRVDDGTEMEITQAFDRATARSLRPGHRVALRVRADLGAAAVAAGEPGPGSAAPAAP